MAKKREGENNAPKFVPLISINFKNNDSKQDQGSLNHYNPRKIRRSMTFHATADDQNVAEIEKQLLETEEFVLPSFIENGKDMLRRISVATV